MRRLRNPRKEQEARKHAQEKIAQNALRCCGLGVLLSIARTSTNRIL